MQYYKVTLRVPVKMLSTIMEVLDGEGVLISAVPDEGVEVANGAKVRKNRYFGGRRSKGISGEELALQCLKDGPQTEEAITPTFQSHGFAVNSVSAVLSKARRDNLVSRLTDGRWALFGWGITQAGQNEIARAT